MLKYIVHRLILTFFTLIVSLFLVFCLNVWFGRDPIVENAESLVHLFPKNTPLKTVIDVLSAQEGFDRSAFVRFFSWVQNIFSGSAGKVYSAPGTVISTTFYKPIRYTIIVVLPATIITYIFGIFFGFWAAYRRGKIADRLITAISNVVIGVPNYIFASVLLTMAIFLNIPAQFRNPNEPGNTYWDAILSLIPPLIALTVPSIAGIVVFVRNLGLTHLNSNHALIAKSKGLSKLQIFFKHIIRNALVPLVPGIIGEIIGLLQGSLIIEQIFGIPGSSKLFIDWQSSGEINVIMFNILNISLFNRIGSVIADVSYQLMDPNIIVGRTTGVTKLGVLIYRLRLKFKKFVPKIDSKTKFLNKQATT